MNAKQNTVLIGLIAALVVLGGAGAWFVMQERTKVAELKDKITSTESQIQELQSKTVTPDEKNIKLLEDANAQLVAKLGPAIELVDSGRLTGENIAPIDFQTRVREMQKELIQKAGTTNDARYVELPANFTFGFGRYLTTIPDRADTVALTLQLKLVQTLVNLLFEAGVDSLDAVRRLPLEDLGANAKSDDKEALEAFSVDRPNQPYYCVPTVLEFTCDEVGLRNFVNGLLQLNTSRGLLLLRTMQIKSTLSTPPTIDALTKGEEETAQASATTTDAPQPALQSSATASVLEGKIGSLEPKLILGTDEEKLKVVARVDYIEWKTVKNANPKGNKQ